MTNQSKNPFTPLGVALETPGSIYDLANPHRKNQDFLNKQQIQRNLINAIASDYAQVSAQQRTDTNTIGIQLQEVSNGTIITVGVGLPNRVIRICPKEETLSDQITAALAEFKLK